MKQPASEHRDSVLWLALKATLDELTKTGEIKINTAPDYVIAHLCRELVAKQLVTGAALSLRDGGMS
jgi:hypothetical protein